MPRNHDDWQAAQQRRKGKGRFAWAVTGSGHGLVESMDLARRLPGCELMLSAAGEEVLGQYRMPLEQLRQDFVVMRDKSASGVPVGRLYEDIYHTVIVAPATSNTVAKIACGISDTLPTNMVAQAGKLAIPSIIFACDTEPVVITRSPHDWITLRPRRIELENVERLSQIDHCQVARSIDELKDLLDRRLAELERTWNTSSS
ncbi:flavoprotein [Xanthobacter sp. TB0139]|uniref:flavoprotein n=1 Tax=Xanthobacter sp. TB0139 TaxID=3459178 RepID=UPI004039784B